MYIITLLPYQIINLNLNLHIPCLIGEEVVNGNFGASVAINFIGDSVKEYSTGAGSTNFLHIKNISFYYPNSLNIKIIITYLRDFNSCSC